jgi:hypothetical protein
LKFRGQVTRGRFPSPPRAASPHPPGRNDSSRCRRSNRRAAFSWTLAPDLAVAWASTTTTATPLDARSPPRLKVIPQSLLSLSLLLGSVFLAGWWNDSIFTWFCCFSSASSGLQSLRSGWRRRVGAAAAAQAQTRCRTRRAQSTLPPNSAGAARSMTGWLLGLCSRFRKKGRTVYIVAVPHY